MAAFEPGWQIKRSSIMVRIITRSRIFFDRIFGSSRHITQVRIWKEDRQGIRIKDEMLLGEDHALFWREKPLKKPIRWAIWSSWGAEVR